MPMILWFVAGAHAETPDTLEPGFAGTLSLHVLSDDNIYRTESNQISDLAFVLTPSLTHMSVFNKHRLDLGYTGAYAAYSDKSDENYNDSKVNADFLMDLSPKLSMNLGAKYTWSHDSRGASGASMTPGLEPDTWEELAYNLDVVYGRRTSQAQVQLKYEGIGREFTNNNQASRNRDTGTLYLTAYYNMTARSSWLLEMRSRNITYTDAPSSDRDSTEFSYMLGSRWDFTGITTGVVRLGMLSKDLQGTTDYYGNSLEDFSGFTAEGSVDWAPQPIDRFKLGLTRQARESTEVTSSYYISNMLNIAWHHDFSSLFALDAGIGAQNDEFSDGRSDELTNVTMGGGYGMTQHMRLEFNYTYGSKSSSLAGADFTSNVLMLTGTYVSK